MSQFDLFHKIADSDCAYIRRRISELGLKAQFNFRNVDTGETAAIDLEAHGGNTESVPAVWDGKRLIVGRAAIDSILELERR